MARGPRAYLIAQLRERMLPFLESKGFERRPFPRADQKDASELRAAFPLGSMRRRSGSNLEVVEIQLAKRGAAKFVLNFGTVPPEGVSLPEARLPQDEVNVMDLPEAFSLHSRRMFAPWFSLGWGSAPAEEKARRAVARAIELFPEVDAWFTNRTIGPHMRDIGYGTAPGK